MPLRRAHLRSHVVMLGLSFLGSALPLLRSGRMPLTARAAVAGRRRQPLGLDVLPLFSLPPFFPFSLASCFPLFLTCCPCPPPARPAMPLPPPRFPWHSGLRLSRTAVPGSPISRALAYVHEEPAIHEKLPCRLMVTTAHFRLAITWHCSAVLGQTADGRAADLPVGPPMDCELLNITSRHDSING